MTREDAKDLTLSILVIVVALLIADCIWLHVKCAGQQGETGEIVDGIRKGNTRGQGGPGGMGGKMGR